MDLAILESRALDIEFIDGSQLKNLLDGEPKSEPPVEIHKILEEKPPEENLVEEIPAPEDDVEDPLQPPAEEILEIEPSIEEVEPEPPEIEAEEEPQNLEEVIDEELSQEDEFADEGPVDEAEVEVASEPEENVEITGSELEIEVPEQIVLDSPSVEEFDQAPPKKVEVIQSAVKLRKERRAQVQRKFSSVVKTLKVDLRNRSQKVKENVNKKSEEQKSEKRVKKVKTLVTDNSELFRKRQIAAKWKHYDMSSVKQQRYAMAVSEFMRPRWNIPMELDPDLVIKVRFKIARNGQILDYEVVESSESRLFNAHVLQVIKNLDHLPPLPEGFKGESTNYGMTFRP